MLHGAKAIAKNVLGIGLATSVQINQRRGICHNCPNKVQNLVATCNLCHCIIEQKIMQASEKCPANKWTS